MTDDARAGRTMSGGEAALRAKLAALADELENEPANPDECPGGMWCTRAGWPPAAAHFIRAVLAGDLDPRTTDPPAPATTCTEQSPRTGGACLNTVAGHRAHWDCNHGWYA